MASCCARLGPVLVILAIIFISSAQPKLPPPSGTATGVYFSGAMPVFGAGWETLIKKGAHVLIYGVLALLLLRALVGSGHDPRTASYLAILLSLCYALTDELHQSMVPGRQASIFDLGLDYIGATTASLLGYRLVHHARRRKHPDDAAT